MGPQMLKTETSSCYLLGGEELPVSLVPAAATVFNICTERRVPKVCCKGHVMESVDYYLSILRRIDSSKANVSSWEAGFIESILQRNYTRFSDRQISVIERMKEKYLTEQEVSELQMFDDPDGDDIPY